jgi:hypothetical protein
MEFFVNVRGAGCKSKIRIFIDNDENGIEIGQCEVGMDDGTYNTVVKNVTGTHAVFLVIEADFGGHFVDMFKGRHLFELVSFVFVK